MAVPLTPGSLGVRESLFVSLFKSVMVDQPHAIFLSLLVYGGGVFWSLAGGLVYLAMSAGEKLPETFNTWQDVPEQTTPSGAKYDINLFNI